MARKSDSNLLLAVEVVDEPACLYRCVMAGHLRLTAARKIVRAQVDLHAAARNLQIRHPGFWLCSLSPVRADDLIAHGSFLRLYAKPMQIAGWVKCSRDQIGAVPVTFFLPPYPSGDITESVRGAALGLTEVHA